MTGGEADIYHLLNYSVLLSGLLSGEVYIIEEVPNGHKVVAAAVWFPPNRELFEEFSVRFVRYCALLTKTVGASKARQRGRSWLVYSLNLDSGGGQE